MLCNVVVVIGATLVGSSLAIDSDFDMSRIVVKFAEVNHWYKVLIITDSDHKDNIDVSKIFFQFYIQNTIITVSGNSPSHKLQTYLHLEVEARVIVWCKTLCLQYVVQNSKDLYKTIHWLLVYNNNLNYTTDTTLLNKLIRADSNIFLLVPHKLQTWLIIRFRYKQQQNVVWRFKVLPDNEIITAKVVNDDFKPVLRGIKLKTSIFNFPPITFAKAENGELIVGQSIRHDILVLLSQHLGFIIDYEMLKRHMLSPTKAEFPFNTQLRMVENKQYDLTGAFPPLTFPMIRNTSHTSSIFTITVGVLIRNIKYTSKKKKSIFYIYGQPFTSMVWICFIPAIFVCVLVSLFAEHHCRFWTPEAIIQNFCIIFLCQGVSEDVITTTSSNAKKIFISVTSMFIFLVVTYYSSYLTSSFAATIYEVPFKGVNDLIDDGSFKYGTVNGSTIMKLMEKTTSDTFLKLRATLKYKSVDTFAQGRKVVLEENYAFFCSSELCANLSCDYVVLRKKYFSFGITILFPKNSEYAEPFSKAVHQLRSSGILSRVLVSLNENQRQSECKSIGRENDQIYLSQVILPFIILAFGAGLSILVLLLEVVIHK